MATEVPRMPMVETGVSNADGGNRRLDGHLAGLGDIARNHDEKTLDQQERGRVGA
jgi:hypothetical protein